MRRARRPAPLNLSAACLSPTGGTIVRVGIHQTAILSQSMDNNLSNPRPFPTHRHLLDTTGYLLRRSREDGGRSGLGIVQSQQRVSEDVNSLPAMSSTTSTATPPRHVFEQSVEEVKLSKSDLNKVIMEYLTSEGYPLAAQKFALEANMQTDLDIDTIKERVIIRDAIHSGDIKTAIERINDMAPELLDTDHALHFALLRLQLIELIRNAMSTGGDIDAALSFATTHLAPRAPTNQYFLDDLEQTMALLIFEPDKLAPSLAHQLNPTIRRETATRVNEALLRSQSHRAKATLYDFVNHRAWAHQKAIEMKKMSADDQIQLGFDPPAQGRTNSPNGSTQPNATADAMATDWETN